jgi:hypothetical protein
MRYLPQFLTNFFGRGTKSDVASWSRDTLWRQGGVLPSACSIRLGLLGETETSDKLAIVVSHDCDLAEDAEKEPAVEVIICHAIEKCDGNRTYAKNPRILNLEIISPSGRSAFELIAREKSLILKRDLAGFSPDPAYVLDEEDKKTLQNWLAARYRRASIPDGLQGLVKSIFEEVGKRKENPKALRGFWIDSEPDSDKLGAGENYELWIAVVYATAIPDSKNIAEDAARLLGEKFRQKFFKDDVWHGIDLRECKAVADTEFTLFDTFNYKLFRLEHLSLKLRVPTERGDE